jgi:hypothetical protein
MRFGLRLCLILLSAIILLNWVSAYDSFFIAEQTDSSQVVIIHSLDSSEVLGEGTVIKLTRTEGDFSDLISYLKSNVTQILFYGNDDINGNFSQMIRAESGIPAMVKFGKLGSNGSVQPLDRGPPVVEVDNTTTEYPIVNYGKSAREKTSGVSPVEPSDTVVVETPTPVVDVNNTSAPASVVEPTSELIIEQQNSTQEITQPITGHAISEKETSTSNFLIIGLVIGLCLIVGFVLLGLIIRRK